MHHASAFVLCMASALLMSCGEPLRDDARATEATSAPSLQSTADTAYRFDNYANLPDGFSDLFKPREAAPLDNVAYMKDIDRAYFELRQGNFTKAAESFAKIGAETLFETPNSATWAGHAESLCRAGNKAAGRKQLNEAQCSQQLMSQKESCNDLDNRKSEPDFPSACYREYCEALILRPDFEPPYNPLDAEYKERLERYAGHLGEVESYCR